MVWHFQELPVFAAIPIAESSGSIENTVIGAVIIASAIAVSKLLESWWVNRRADTKQVNEDVRADKDQVFKLQEQFIVDLLVRIQKLEIGSMEKDSKILNLEIQHSQCQADHAECKQMIEDLKVEISNVRNKNVK